MKSSKLIGGVIFVTGLAGTVAGAMSISHHPIGGWVLLGFSYLASAGGGLIVAGIFEKKKK